MMAGIRGKNTQPELILRGGLHALGFRYRVHVAALPGKPDLVFPSRHAVLFAHGCFWHGHDCHLFKQPSSRSKFWAAKIAKNRENDSRAIEALAAAGWRVGVVWECAIKGRSRRPLESVIESCATWLKADERHFELRGFE
ncbi:DNA mismatch endonuclease of very short patch repair [Methylocella tundrae]|uniref:DNA mismatch endonuclease of very short patch repair n=2 Tax=Methylocella tundrae TaxID=227605 RepID=A0A4V6IMN1_METTU|nr:DNA mismatch endonuclease of very short patch repair [Methylocella tundrae]